MKTITMLLDEASKIIKEHEQNRITNGDDFNIFKITGIQSDEVKMCRMLAEITDPMGSHNQGMFFIRSFVKDVLNIEMIEEELKTAKVHVLLMESLKSYRHNNEISRYPLTFPNPCGIL